MQNLDKYWLNKGKEIEERPSCIYPYHWDEKLQSIWLVLTEDFQKQRKLNFLNHFNQEKNYTWHTQRKQILGQIKKLDMKYTKKREIGVNKEIRSSLDDLHYFAITFWLMNESGQMYERSRRHIKGIRNVPSPSTWLPFQAVPGKPPHPPTHPPTYFRPRTVIDQNNNESWE